MEDTVPTEPGTDSIPPGDSRIDPGVVVGLDGSSGSMNALRWAVARADRFGPVQPVATWRFPWWAHAMPIPPPADQFRQLAVHAVQDAKYLLETLLEPGSVRPAVICRADAGSTLVDVGANENLIVVGTRGRSGLKDTLLGSVSSYVATHARTPVAVIPAQAPTHDLHQRLVVGVDGSVNSIRGLSWAVKHTPPTTTIEAVLCWTYPASTMPDLAAIPRNVYEDQARFVLDEAVDAVHRAVGTMAHKVVRRLEYGDSRSILRHRSESADMLVLGARGLGGLSHLLLGSTTTALVHRPQVPTVVIPSREWVDSQARP